MGNKMSSISNVETNLPLASLCVFGLISSFWAFFVMTVTTFIRGSQGTTPF